MNRLDSLAEDFVLIHLRIKNLANENFYAMKANSSTNPDWDIIAFDTSNTQNIKKTTYQVKGINFAAISENKSIQGNFESIKKNVDYLMIVIFNAGKDNNIINSSNGKIINPDEPIIFEIDTSMIESKNSIKGLFAKDNKWLYKNKTMSLNTIFNQEYSQILLNYSFYNYE